MVKWEIFGNIQEDTGYSTEVLDYIWDQYNWLFRNEREMYNMYTYIHLYPTLRQSQRIFNCCKITLEEVL